MVMTKSEIEKAAESTPDKPSSQQSTDETTSTPRMLTEDEHRKLLTDAVNAARGEEGRKNKRLLTEAQNRANNELASLKRANDELQAALDEMAEDDEDKTRTAKILKDNLKRERDLEAEKQVWNPTVAEAKEYVLTRLCEQVVKDYEGADSARLMRIARRTTLSDDKDEKEEQIRSLADDIWAKKTATPVKQPPKEEPRKMDSGITTGKIGLTAKDVEKMSPEEQRRRRTEIAAIPFS